MRLESLVNTLKTHPELQSYCIIETSGSHSCSVGHEKEEAELTLVGDTSKSPCYVATISQLTCSITRNGKKQELSQSFPYCEKTAKTFRKSLMEKTQSATNLILIETKSKGKSGRDKIHVSHGNAFIEELVPLVEGFRYKVRDSDPSFSKLFEKVFQGNGLDVSPEAARFLNFANSGGECVLL